MAERLRKTLHELLPVAERSAGAEGRRPGRTGTLLDYTSEQVNEFAFKALSRRLKAIGVPLIAAGPGREAEESASDSAGVPA